MTKHVACTALWVLSLLACNDTSEDSGLPDIVASSKYIDYSPFADTSVLCMDDVLAYLGVDTPSGRIRYVWEPQQEFGDSQTWACEGNALSCYIYRDRENFGLIRSLSFAQYHELVHAVDIPMLGKGHRTLVEGLAEYLGSSSSSQGVLEGFSDAFKAMVMRSPQPDDYRLAMHFVGSILLSHGVDKYKALRKALPADGDLGALEVAFEAVYGETLSAALISMSDAPILGVQRSSACVAGEGEELTWTSPGLIETTLRGECGDGTFIGPGFVDSRAGFRKGFAVEIAEAGYYEMTIVGPEPASEQPSFSFSPCPGVQTGIFDGAGGLYPGRYELGVGFPAGPEARGEATFRLEFIAPFDA